MDRRIVIEWFIFLAMLIILPNDSRLAADIKPEDWYGEIQIPVGDRLVVIGKNSAQETVDLGLKNITASFTLQADHQEGFGRTDLGGGLPNSVVVAEAPRWMNYSGRTVDLGGKHHFTPTTLVLLTRADLYTMYIAIVIMMVLFMILGFIIAQYVSAQETPLRHTGRLRKGRMQR